MKIKGKGTLSADCRFSSRTKHALKDPKLREQLESMSAEPLPWSAQALGKFEHEEAVKWAEIVKTSDVSVN